MAEVVPCPRCGAMLRGIGSSGLCPSCLLGLGTEDEPDLPEDVGAPIPVYRVLTILSSESDRTTYLAEQDRPRRLVSLDVVRLASGAAADDEPGGPRTRLRALVRWSHPAVPPVLDGRRTPAGDFCVVSRYAAGAPLARYCDARGLDAADRVRLFAEVCDAVEDGHRRGICHGRIRSDLVVAAEAGQGVVPQVLGYSVSSAAPATIEDDVMALAGLAWAMGWSGATRSRSISVEDLRAAAAGGWADASPCDGGEAAHG